MKLWLLFQSMKNVTEMRQRKQLEQQRRLTITLGISCVLTTCLVVIPQGLILLSYRLTLNVNSIVPFSYIFYQANPICNFYLFMKRHKDIRKAVLKRLGCPKSFVGADSTTSAIVSSVEKK